MRKMKKWITTFLVIIVSMYALCCGATGETSVSSRIQNADQVQWASENYIMLDWQMICVKDGEILFDTIDHIVSTGNYAWIETTDGIYIMDKTGNVHVYNFDSEDSPIYAFEGKCGLFYGSMGDQQGFIYNPATDTVVLKLAKDRKIADVYHDSDGQVYILTEDCGIYKENGEQVLEEGRYRTTINCNYNRITNEYLTAYDQDGSAVVLSPFTGEVISVFPGMGWVSYDENHMIFRDNTALIGPLTEEGYSPGEGTKIVGLDGTVLKEVAEGQWFRTRGEAEWWYSIETYENRANYIPVTNRTYWFEGEDTDSVQYIVCEETGERFESVKDDQGNISWYKSVKTGKIYQKDEDWLADFDPIKGRLEEYRPVFEKTHWLKYIDADWEQTTSYRIGITSPDGNMLGNRYWKAIADEWYSDNTFHIGGYDIGGYKVFENAPVCAVEDENGLYAVINTKGKTVLPSEYEQINLIGSFSDDPKVNGHCLAAKKNDQWYVFNEQGELLFTDTLTQSGTEISSVSISAAGSELHSSGDYEYRVLADNAVEIIGYFGKDAELIIPAELDGRKVTAIGNNLFALNDNLQSAVIPEGVTTIGKDAFFHCGRLKTVTIPDSVTEIKGNPFRCCDEINEFILSPDHPALMVISGVLVQKTGQRMICYPGGLLNEEYTIPSGIQVIGNGAFYQNKKLSTIVIPDDVTIIEENSFFRCKNLSTVIISDSVSSIGQFAFFDCENLSSAEIPVGVLSLGDSAFQNCANLNSITIPDTLSFMGSSVFSGCKELASVIIQEGVKMLGDGAFFGCANLNSVTIPGSVISIGNQTFKNCTNLRSVTIMDGVASIGDRALEKCENLESIIIPDSVRMVGNYVFSGCRNLNEVTLPDGLSSIGEGMFSYCSKLTEVTIPDSVTTIGDYAFSNCDSLIWFVIPRCITRIGVQAFGSSDNLFSVYIPSSVLSMGRGAFADCKDLASVEIENGVTSIADAAFSGCRKLTSITIPDSVTAIGESAFEDCSSLKSIEMTNSVNTIGDSAFKGCKRLVSVIMPEGISAIGNYLFYGCISMSGVRIPESVRKIGRSAFEACSRLRWIMIPDGVTAIEDETFRDCVTLDTVVIPDSVTAIGDRAFFSCTSLETIRIPDGVTTLGVHSFHGCSKLKTVNIPHGLTSISYGLFYNCSELETVAIPDNITSMDGYAFAGCEGLNSIIIPDSVTSMKDDVFKNCDNLILYVSRNSYAAQYCQQYNLKYSYLQ